MIFLATIAKTARLNGLKSAISGSGTGTAQIRLYSGTMPADFGAPQGQPLVTINLDASVGTVSGDTLTLDVPPSVTVSASGVIGWGRIISKDGDTIADMTVGMTGSGQAIEVNSLTVYAGGLLSIASAQLRE